jgi:hypothetical protein
LAFGTEDGESLEKKEEEREGMIVDCGQTWLQKAG